MLTHVYRAPRYTCVSVQKCAEICTCTHTCTGRSKDSRKDARTHTRTHAHTQNTLNMCVFRTESNTYCTVDINTRREHNITYGQRDKSRHSNASTHTKTGTRLHRNRHRHSVTDTKRAQTRSVKKPHQNNINISTDAPHTDA
jgi:hypothetical protein